MRRSTLLGGMVLPAVLFLGGCSGLGEFFGDTITLPGANPNLPYGLNENAQRAEGRTLAVTPILPQQGNVWPGPPQPLPTLSDVAHTSGNGLHAPNYGTDQSGPLLGPTQGQPLRNGGSLSMGEGDMVAHGVPQGTFQATSPGTNNSDDFNGGGSTLPSNVPDTASQFRLRGNSGVKNPPIVIPNGDGTYTVIEPNGQVKTMQHSPR